MSKAAKRYLWIAVDADEKELPQAVGNSLTGLAEIMDKPVETITSAYFKGLSGKNSGYRVVRVEEEEMENERYCICCGDPLEGKQRLYCTKCHEGKRPRRNQMPETRRGPLVGLTLDDVALKARETGMSYGQYVAKHEGWSPRVKPARRA